MYTLAETLDSVDTRLRAALPPAGLERVRGVAAALPAELTHWIYFEQWLDERSSRADLILRVEPSERGCLTRPSFLGQRPEWRAHPAWQRVFDFARAWQADARFERAVAGIWLEFDLGDENADPPAPRVFVDFERELIERLTVAELFDLARLALRPLLAGGLDAAAERALRGCLDALPPGATLPYVCASGAAARPLRVCVRGLGRRVPAYLHAVGWPGDEQALEDDLLAPLSRARGDESAGPSIAHLDLGHDVGPRVGLELPFARVCQLRGALDDHGLLDHLVARGWCDPATRAALESWPGQTVELLRHQIWHSRVLRRINHVKLTCASGEPVGLKAYLCLYHELLSAGTLVGTRPRMFGKLPFPRPRAGAGAPRDGAATPATMPTAVSRPAGGLENRKPGSGTRLAWRVWRGGIAMSISVKEQQLLDEVIRRSVVDYEFRKQLLSHPRKAIEEALGVSIPPHFRIKFIEKDKNVDALVVLPNFECPEGELSEDALESVAGGGGTNRPTDPDWTGVP